MKNEKWKLTNGKWLVVALLIAAAAFRIAVAHWLPNDGPDDGRIYAQMARNVLEQHVYSHATEPPYEPSLIRLPGYPLFLAAIYSVFGHANNGAVRIVQALIDTGTCALIGLLAFCWQPDPKKKKMSGIAALALATVCPFTTIYVATILTESLTMFLLIAMLVAATLALRKTITAEDAQKDRKTFRQAVAWWCLAGFIGALAVFMRPDAALFVAAVGITLVVAGLIVLWRLRKKRRDNEASELQRGTAPTLSTKTVLARVFVSGAALCVAFVLMLAPWTIRNWRVFHVFQPIAPAHAEMPGEFVPRGYSLWLRTWLDDQSYVAPFLWSLDTDPIDIDDVPPYAYDSPDEKNRIAALLDKYNHPADSESANAAAMPQVSQPSLTPSPSPSATGAKPAEKSTANSNARNGSEAAENDNSDNEDANNEEQTDESQPEEPTPVEMTPEIDAGFAQLAHERIARHRFQFYVWLPLKRAHTMWFDTHSQYWPFEGTLMPLEDLDYEHHQQIWLPLFAGLTALYTIVGLAGLWLLWTSGKFEARLCAVLTGLAILLRLVLISAMENPEPRYLVEFFPLLSVLAGIAIAVGISRLRSEKPAAAKN
jgi:hypothetical protein